DVDATTFAYTDLSASSRHSSPFLFTQNSPLRALGATFAGHARRSDRVEGWRPGGLRFDFEWLIHYSCGSRCAHTVSAYSLSVAKDFETSSSANEVRLWLVLLMMLRGLPLVLQAACSDGLAFNPFSLQQDCRAASEVDVGRG